MTNTLFQVSAYNNQMNIGAGGNIAPSVSKTKSSIGGIAVDARTSSSILSVFKNGIKNGARFL